MEPESTENTTEPRRASRRGGRERGRRKRRRSRRPTFTVPRRRLVGALVFLLVAGGIAAALPSLRRALAGSPWAASIKPEFLALFVAALAGVWLIPGVEDKVLQGLGLRKRPRKHRRRQRTRSAEVPADEAE